LLCSAARFGGFKPCRLRHALDHALSDAAPLSPFSTPSGCP
jgi:hypothetical protein